MVRDTLLIRETPPGQGACLLLCQSCILNCFLFLSSAIFFLPMYLDILVVSSHLAESVRLLLDAQQSLLKLIREPSLCASFSPAEVRLGLCCMFLRSLAHPAQWHCSLRILIRHGCICHIPYACSQSQRRAPGHLTSWVLRVPYIHMGFPWPFGPRNCWFTGHVGMSQSCAHCTACLGMLQPLQCWESRSSSR